MTFKDRMLRIVGRPTSVVATRNKLTGAKSILILIGQRDLYRDAQYRHAKTRIVPFDRFILDGKLQPIVDVKPINTVISPVEDTPLGNAVALRTQYGFGDGDNRLTNQ